jgi:mono/diheme cytochrome c family protein
MTRHVALASGVLCSMLSAVVLATAPNVSWKLFPDAAAPAVAPSGKNEFQTGKAEFQNACAICHGAGPDRPGTSSLQFKYGGRLPALLEERTDLTAERVKYYIRHGIAMMPGFRKTELSDAQAEAIANYLARKR